MVPPFFARYSLAFSSDQKNTDFLQNASIMLGSFSFNRFTFGIKISGFAPLSICLILNSLSISIFKGFPEFTHSDLIEKDIALFRNFPCTKGVAIASIAQAAFIDSPVLNET